jgi:hypothetical protein
MVVAAPLDTKRSASKKWRVALSGSPSFRIRSAKRAIPASSKARPTVFTNSPPCPVFRSDPQRLDTHFGGVQPAPKYDLDTIAERRKRGSLDQSPEG